MDPVKSEVEDVRVSGSLVDQREIELGDVQQVPLSLHVSLASSVDEVNNSVTDHGDTITLEDPVESVTLDESGIATAECVDEVDDDLGLMLNSDENVIIQHMDIAEPLEKLRQLLETRLGQDLHDYDFYLQNSMLLDPNKNLVEQCVHGEGTVQINIQIEAPGDISIKPRLNIVDILKPAEDFETHLSVQENHVPTPTAQENGGSDKVTRWLVDQEFRQEQTRSGIPHNPSQWTTEHVQYWLRWAMKQFRLSGISPRAMTLTGKELCDLKHDQFAQIFPYDPDDFFWTHLELLRKCKFVAVVQETNSHSTSVSNHSAGSQRYEPYGNQATMYPQHKLHRPRSPRITGDRAPGTRTGNNGQVQLWQFLLELLTDKDCRDVIQWVTEDGEFKLMNPELVAQLWGARKNKPTMNYEKLSRALRYYYDGDMIAKVHGKKFVYKFICDLRHLLGYSAADLAHLVNEAAERKSRSSGLGALYTSDYILSQNYLPKHK